MSRGGKGFEAVKRTWFVRVVPPPIELVDWDQVEGREKPKEKAAERNGDGKNGEGNRRGCLIEGVQSRRTRRGATYDGYH